MLRVYYDINGDPSLSNVELISAPRLSNFVVKNEEPNPGVHAENGEIVVNRSIR